MSDNLKENFRQFRIEHDNRIAMNYVTFEQLPPPVDLGLYVEKEFDKGLSTNDFTDEDKSKLDSINPSDFATKNSLDEAVMTLSSKQLELEQAKIGGDTFPIATDSEINRMLNSIF